MSSFYSKVNELCSSRGISITALALELGLSKGTPTNWKKMTESPRRNTVKAVADYFGLPYSPVEL
jgi:transcriptional regulator with XRE-family HTH domain